MKKKYDVFDIFVCFKAFVEFFFNKQVIQLCTDNGGEYLALKIFLAHHGVSHLTTPLHTIEHNGYLELASSSSYS